MVRKGRKPLPNKLKILRGNPGRRPISEAEPKPEPGVPRAPDWLSPVARQEWERIVPRLAAIGLLTMVDGFALEGFCVSYGHWVEHERIIARTGTVYSPSNKKNSKYLQQVPHVSIAQKYLALARMFATELGLSPSARVGLTTHNDVEPDSPLEKMLQDLEKRR